MTTSGRQYIDLPNKSAELPFHDAVLANGTLYLSGRIGFEPETRKVPAEPEQEARYLLDQIQQVLREAGMTMDDLVQVQIFCSDVSLFERFNKVYGGYFKRELPARAFLGSGPLLFGARFEMMGIAVKR